TGFDYAPARTLNPRLWRWPKGAFLTWPQNSTSGGRLMTTFQKADTALWLEVNDFLIYEARLLDDRKFHDWLDLLADDLFYFMPRKKNRQRKDMAREVTEVGDLAMFEEDKESMKMRI